MTNGKNPQNHTYLMILRFLKAQHPNAVSVIVMEKVIPGGVYQCSPATLRDNLTTMQINGYVESIRVGSHAFDRGYLTYRITDKGIDELNAWLPEVSQIDTNLQVSSYVFDRCLSPS